MGQRGRPGRLIAVDSTEGVPNKWKRPDGTVDFDKVLKENHRLILYVMEKSRLCVPDMDDPVTHEFYSAGQIKLCRAAQKWDPSIAKWSTYACTALYRALYHTNTIRNKDRCRSLSTVIEGHGERRLIEQNSGIGLEDREILAWCLRRLSPQYRKIFYRYYIKGWTLDQVGERLGVCRERTRQILNQGMITIRGALAQRDIKIKATKKLTNSSRRKLRREMEELVMDYNELKWDKPNVFCPVCAKRILGLRPLGTHMRAIHRMDVEFKNVPLPKPRGRFKLFVHKR